MSETNDKTTFEVVAEINPVLKARVKVELDLDVFQQGIKEATNRDQSFSRYVENLIAADLEAKAHKTELSGVARGLGVPGSLLKGEAEAGK